MGKINVFSESLCFIDKGEKSGAYPAFYIKNLYDIYIDNGKNINYVLHYIANTVTKYMDDNSFINSSHVIIDQLLNYDSIMDNTVMVLVKKEGNENLLKTVPYIDYLDFAIIFRYILEKNSDSFSGAIINNDVVQVMGLDKDELYKVALENTKAIHPIKFRQIESVVCGDNEYDCNNIGPLFELTNDISTEGASYIVYDEVLSYIRNRLNADLVILPISIDQVIVASSNDLKIEEARELSDVLSNKMISEENKLSKDIYYYNGELKRIS